MSTVKIDLKVYATVGNGSPEGALFDAAAAIPVFHRWIREQSLDELMVDVADYSHVPEGPGVLLVCHDAHYALDGAGGEPGLLYSRRRATSSSASDVASLDERLETAFARALAACALLEAEEALAPLHFPGDRFLVRFNDRRVEHSESEALAAALRRLFERLQPGVGIETRATRGTDSRCGVVVELAQKPGVAALAERLTVAGGVA
jgi:hypothetical protein